MGPQVHGRRKAGAAERAFALPATFRVVTMPRYHLHIHCGGEVIRDDEGGKFADLDGAVHEAVRSIRSLACGDVVAGFLHLDLFIEICDGDVSPLKMVSFEDAVTIRGDAERQAALD